VDGIATIEGVSGISFFTYRKMTGNFRFADALRNASTCTVFSGTSSQPSPDHLMESGSAAEIEGLFGYPQCRGGECNWENMAAPE
jgi:hypothetical protein